MTKNQKWAVLAALLLFATAAYAATKISDYTALTGAGSATGDLFAIVDIDASETKNITRGELSTAITAENDMVAIAGDTMTGALGIDVASAATNSATNVLDVTSESTGTPAAGIGVGQTFTVETADGNNEIGCVVEVVATDVTSTDEDFDYVVSCMLSGDTATEVVRFNSAGQVVAQDGSASLPSITLDGLPTTGLFRSTSAIGFTHGGTQSFLMFNTSFGGGGSSAAQILIAPSSATVPGFTPSRDDPNTGIGHAGADQLSMIAGGVEALRVTTTSANLGLNATAADNGQFAFASGQFAAPGDAQTSVYTLRNTTTNSTQTELFTDGSSAAISVSSGCVVTIRASYVAAGVTAGGGYLVTAVLENEGGTTALIGSATTTTVGEDETNWDVTITADDANDEINVLVTGEAPLSINWVARAEVVTAC